MNPKPIRLRPPSFKKEDLEVCPLSPPDRPWPSTDIGLIPMPKVKPPSIEKPGVVDRMLAAMCGNCANSVRCKLPEYCEQRKAVIAAAGEITHG
jgi:hypothetical protein